MLFIHGLGGGSSKTWGAFPELIAKDTQLAGFDVAFFDYPASLFSGRFRKTAPKAQRLARALHTEITNKYRGYAAIVLVAHSLGGLVARRYLADRVMATVNTPDAATPVTKLLLYAVPNDGAGLAAVGRHLSRRQRQIKQLCRDSEFIDDLNTTWETLHVGDRIDLRYVVAAQDAVVSEKSASGLQGLAHPIDVLVNCDHRSCVKPRTADDLAFIVLKNFVRTPPPARPTPAAGASGRMKVIGFDLDGSLLRGLTFSWTLVWRYLDYPADVQQKGMREFLTGKKEYAEWCSWAVSMFQARQLTRADLQGLAKTLTVTKNLEQAVTMLKQRGFTVALISGGIDVFLYEKIPNADELFDHIFINRLEFDANGVVSGVKATEYDFKGKADALQLVAESVGCTLAESVFVGDGFNDGPVSAQAGLSIAYPPISAERSAVSTYRIEEDDLMRVTEIVLSA